MPQKSAAMVAVRKKVERFDKLIRERYIGNLENYYIPTMIEIILVEYDGQLTGQVTDRKSRTNPLFYRDEFQEALMNHEWIREGRNETILDIPEVDTFNWRQGRLRVIEKILEGLIGQYVEVDGEQYVAMYRKPPALEAFDKTVPRKERIYTLRLSNAVRRKWAETFPKKPLVKYPFSNQPPVDIFQYANTYAEENMSKWSEEAIREAKKEIGK
jgi:hypothetical protein